MQEPQSSAPLERRRRFFTSEALASLVFFLFLWYFWGVRYGDYLFAVQENSLFLYDPGFLARWLQVPEGLLCYATSFLMQFFYLPLVGGLIFAALASLGQVLLVRLTGFKGVAQLLTFLPAALIAVATTWHAYYVFIPYEQPMVFAESLALLVSLLCLALYRVFAAKRWRWAVGVAFVVLLYPFFGFWGIMATILCAIWELGLAVASRKDVGVRNASLVCAAIMIVAALVVPLCWRQLLFYLSIKPSDVFNRGLLEDIRYDKNSITARLCYGLATAVPVIAALLIFASRALPPRDPGAPPSRRSARQEERRNARIAAKKSRKNKKDTKDKKDDPGISDEEKRAIAALKKERSRARVYWELLIALMACVFLCSYHTKSYFIVLKQARALGDENWEEMLRVEANDPFPISPEVQFRNVALFYTGRLTESVFDRPIAGLTTLSISGFDYGSAVKGNLYNKAKVELFFANRQIERTADRVLCELLYCYWGQPNIAARIAMNNLIAAENRSISSIRTLAIASLITGEEKLARRYLSTLSQTLFYRDWANVRLAYLEAPNFYEGVRDSHDDEAYGEELARRRSERPLATSVAEAAKRYDVAPEDVDKVAAVVERMRALRPVEDYTTTSGYPNLVFLYQVVKEEEFDETTPERQDIILISLLMQRKSDAFLEKIEPILEEKYPNGGAPKAFEQGYATWRFWKYGGEDWQKCDYKFSPETIGLFTQFVDYINASQGVGNINSIPVQETLRATCQGLYWGYACDDSVFNQY